MACFPLFCFCCHASPSVSFTPTMLFFSDLFLPPPHTPCFFPSIFCFWPHAHLTHTNKIFQKVPLSTLAHWQRELARAPSVVCLTLHGTAAARRAIFTWGWEKRAPAASPTPPPTKKREKVTPPLPPTPTLHPPYTHPTPTLHPPYTHPTPTLHPPSTHPPPTLHPPYTHPTPPLHPPPPHPRPALLPLPP